MTKGIEDGAPFDLELELITASGRRWVRVICEPEMRDGRCMRLVGTLQDVTGRLDVTVQRAAEEERRRLADDLKLATEAARIGIVVRDLQTGLGKWDTQAFHCYGLPVQASAPSFGEFLDCIHPADRERFEREMNELIEKREARDFDYRVVHADGRVAYLYARTRIERDALGTPRRLVGVVMDVTARRISEMQARAVTEWMELATAAMGIGFFYRDTDQARGVWDARTRMIFGIEPHQVVPTAEELLPLIVEEDRDRFLATRPQPDRPHQAREADYRIRRNGELRWIRSRRVVVPMGPNLAPRIYGAVLDVTEQRAAAEERQRLLDRLQLAVEVGSIATWERDLRTGEGRWDPAMFKLVGLRAADRAPPREVAVAMAHPDDRATIEAAWQRLLEVTHAVEFQYRVIRPDGRTVILNTRARAERNPDGSAWRVVGAVIDVTAQQAAQQQVREYGEWLQLAGAATGIGFFQHAADSSYRRVDRQIKAMHGFDPDGPVPSTADFDRVIVEEDRAIVAAARERGFRSDAPVECEYRVRLPSGSVRHIFTRRLRRCDDQGRPLYVIGTAVDVTRSRRTQDAVRQAHERLRLATQTARIGIWQRDVPSGNETWDARMREMYGVSAGWRPTFRNRLNRVHCEDRARAETAIGEQYLGIDHGASEYRIVRPDGEIRTIAENFVVRRDAEGKAILVLGTNLDITDIRQTERQRDELYERMQLVAESVGLGVWDWDLLSLTSVWNDQMYALFGSSREEFAGKSWLDAVHPEDADRARAALVEVVGSGSRFDHEFRVVTRDGAVRWIASRGRVQRDAVGNAVRMTGVNWDITERHHAGAAIRDKEAAERASQAKTEFLSRMSHELRTPLNAILGFAQVLDLDHTHALAPPQRERVGHIQKAGWHLLRLIDEILDLSRIESGNARMSLEDMSLAPLAEECASLMAEQAQQRRIALAVKPMPGSAPMVRADRVRLRQVLLNLLSNAVKYNRDGGSIEVEYGRGDENFALLVVRDTGAGMSAAQLADLFQPFNRLGREHQTIEGTGIGLAISRKLTEQMGGTIEVASEPGHGSEFRVRLPLAKGMPAAAREASTPEASRDDIAGSVLCVDDNPAHRDVVAGLLQRRPRVRLLTAADGVRALALATEEQPSLILIDMQLPDCDGFELRERLLMSTATAAIPCVALSANAAPADIRLAMQKGFIDYWTKPVDAQRLLAGVDGVLGRPAEHSSPH